MKVLCFNVVLCKNENSGRDFQFIQFAIIHMKYSGSGILLTLLHNSVYLSKFMNLVIVNCDSYVLYDLPFIWKLATLRHISFINTMLKNLSLWMDDNNGAFLN